MSGLTVLSPIIFALKPMPPKVLFQYSQRAKYVAGGSKMELRSSAPILPHPIVRARRVAAGRGRIAQWLNSSTRLAR